MDYEAMLERFYKGLDLLGNNVIDIGAHTGRHATPLAAQIGPNGVVMAFEPIPEIREIFINNLRNQDINNVIVYPFALSSNTSVADFNYIPNLPEESGLKKRYIYNAVPSEFRKIRVPVKRLDDLVPFGMNISFIKIDVEGAELDVLEGALALLKRDMPIVAFECGAASFLGYHETPEKIYDIFIELGYVVYSITGDFMKDREMFKMASYAQNYWDYIALPPNENKVISILGK
jgi:FkbM family methyltransferase